MSGFYIGVDGKARKVKGAYIGVDGVARKLKKIYVGDADGKARMCYQSGKKLSEYTVGSTVYLNVDGIPTEFLVVHQGMPASYYGADGTWLMTKDIYELRQWNSANATYNESAVHKYLTGDFLRKLDANVRDNIIPAKLYYETNATNTVTASVFLPSMGEVGFSSGVNGSSIVTSACLSYFKGAANSKRIAQYNGGAYPWWSRERRYDDVLYVSHISEAGEKSSTRPTSSCGIRPVFVLPSDARF